MNTPLRLLVLLFAFQDVLVHPQNEQVEHYVSLIEEEIYKSFAFTPPTDKSDFRVTSNESQVYGYYDYIIVGAGSTGAVLANRLSETETNSVLLLEAGGTGSEFIDIPAMYTYSLNTEFNWNYVTVPQRNACLGTPNKQCALPRGKGLGGSSLLSGMYYARANKEDFNKWPSQSNPGWSYEQVLPYFIKSENSHVDGDKGYHGIGGNLNVEYSNWESSLFSTFIDANLELGRKIVDYNGEEQLGVAKNQLNTINGRRDNTARAFLMPVANRKNLKILTHSLAIKILIDPKTKVANGVLFSKGGRLLEARARKEVIISAGAIASPQLLMLSGIGPRNHLQKLGIPVIEDLSVGKNYQDHVYYFPLNVKTNYTYSTPTLEENVEEFLNGYGPFTLALNVEAFSFVQTKLATVPGVPDIQIVLTPSNRTFEHLGILHHYDDAVFESTCNGVDRNLVFSMYSLLFHAESRGEITLRSKDPYVYPLIDPCYFSDPKGKDLERVYQGINMVMEIINTDAFKKVNATPVYATHPSCEECEFLSRDYWYCQFKHQLAETDDPVGTCKMGPNPAKGAVVDANLRVHGIKNLRVADASIIPNAVTGYTGAVCIMIGEKLSDMIKNGE